MKGIKKIIFHAALNAMHLETDYLELHSLMLKDLQYCRQFNSSQHSLTECCFQTAILYWGRIRESLTDFKFENCQEEITFFKTVKPLFTSEIDYYNLIYHSLLFQPDMIHFYQQEIFWKREPLRLERFIEENMDFYSYYKNGGTEMDKLYFLREANQTGNGKAFKDYDNEQTATSHDPLIATILALERYHAYVQEQLVKLQ